MAVTVVGAEPTLVGGWVDPELEGEKRCESPDIKFWTGVGRVGWTGVGGVGGVWF